MNTSYQEAAFFHYILDNQIFLGSTKPEFFTNQTLKDLFPIAKEFALKYKTSPKKEQLSELIKIKGISDKYNEDIINALYNSKNKLQEYEKEWLEQNIGAWIKLRNMDTVMRNAVAFMKTSSITAENANDIVEKVRHMLYNETSVDFSFNLGSDFFDPESHQQERLSRTSTGYKFIDLCLKGGWWKGSLIVFLGPPKSGKSRWLSNLAVKSVYNGFKTAYITLELQEEIVNMRIGANMLNIPLDDYEEFAKDKDLLKKKLNNLKKGSLKPLGPLHVKEFPSSTMSTNDLRNYLIKAQELLGYKFDNVFVDYINIMKNWRNPNTENLYMKIKQISEDLRAVAQEQEWAIISATQTTRSSWDTNDLVISNVSESAALLHTVDGLFGIITSPEMKSRNEYYLKYMADRVSGYENTRKRFTFEGNYARITEDINSDIEDMDFIMKSVAGTFKDQQYNNKINKTEEMHSKIQNVEKITSKELFESK